ncbi:ATP synthase F0 subunit B [Silvibacterium sp.]|uniref:ATP synthase F0 subunit B n=1 Tax=Silvibacterium sp. TaxID=1964179 RepID=UPI0039E4EA58
MLQDLLRQIGELLLGSVPTAIIFLILVLAYRFVLYGPLKRVLAERHRRTTGAVEKAHAAIAAADSKSQEYEARLRAARAEIFSAREKRVQEWNAQRDKALASARLAAHDRIASARRGIEQESAAARQQIESSTDQLAAQILQAVLPVRAEGAR